MSNNSDFGTISESIIVQGGLTYRPVRIILNPIRPLPSPIGSPIQALLSATKAKTSPVGVNTVGNGGLAAPKQLISVTAVESPAKVQGRTVSEVSVSFVRDTSDKNFASVRLWFTGYNANSTPQLIVDSTQSPISFLVETTKETVVITAQTVSSDGTTSDFNSAKTCTVTLDGVISAPPAPSIAQSLIGTATGYQFSFNEVILSPGTEDVIDSYRVYRGTSTDPTLASLVMTFKHDPTANGAIVFTDTIQAANNVLYYYWVTAVNTAGLESTKTAAQSGNVIGSIGSIPATALTPFALVTTSTTATWTTSPSAHFTRADGTSTTIGQTSTAVTGLVSGNKNYFYPYWRESDQTLQWASASDTMIPNITGVTFTAASSQWIQTTTSASIPATFSFECWVKGTTAANQTLLSFSNVQGTGAPASVEMQAYVTSAGEVAFGIWNGSAWKSVTTAGASVLDGAWHHIVCAYDPSATSGTITIWVDSLDTSDSVTFWTLTSTGTISSTAGYWHIGFAGGFAGAPLTTNTFTSLTMSHVSIYSSALNSNSAGAHFQAFYNLGLSVYDSEVSYDSATSYWKLGETVGSSAADSIGSNTGTYQASPTLNQTTPVVTLQGSPAIAWPFPTLTALQTQNLRTNVPLSGGPMSATMVAGTTSGGGSGGGGGGGFGGGGGRCFTGDTLVKTARGPSFIKSILEGDYVLTAKGTWKPVSLIIHEAEPLVMHELPGGGQVTYSHQILVDGVWRNAGDMFTKTIHTDEPVYNLSVHTNEDLALKDSPITERSFTLCDGTIAHNQKLFTD